MFGIPESIFVPFISILGIIFLGILGGIAKRYGENKPTPGERAVEVAGAIVDSKAVEMLAASIEAHNLEAIQLRAILRTLADAELSLVREVEELRRAVNELSREIYKKG